MGNKLLGHICGEFARDNQLGRAGLPDLILWKTSDNTCKVAIQCGDYVAVSIASNSSIILLMDVSVSKLQVKVLCVAIYHSI